MSSSVWRRRGNRGSSRGSGAPSSLERRGRRLDETVLGKDLEENVVVIQKTLGPSRDLVVRRIALGPGGRMRVAVLYVDAMVNVKLVADDVVRELARARRDPELRLARGRVLEVLEEQVLAAGEVSGRERVDALLTALLSGDTVVLADGEARALVCGTRGYAYRGIEEPVGEVVVRGPREGFTEALRVNLTQLRRRVRDPRLWIENYRVGRLSRTEVALVYVSGVANPALVAEVRRRLERIDVDSVLETGYLEEFIEDSPYSPFPQTLRTERPDTVAGNILEGRVAILVDGTPFALLVPVVLTQLIQVPEDYYERWLIASALRVLRYGAFAAALLTPSVYVAVITFHHEMLPTPLLLSVAAARNGIPFPAVVEAVLMELLFELVREAGVRLPRVVGQAVSIVGALILGDAAVSAGLVSPAMLVAVALTAIASFATPVFSAAIAARLLRFVFVFLASTLGLFGIQFGVLLLVTHLTSLRSFGVPYLTPLAPLELGAQRDVVLRAPWWALRRRPHFLRPQEPDRVEPGQIPKPPPGEPQGRGGGRR